MAERRNQGSLNDLNNYRGITVTSVVYKLYASLLETQIIIMDLLETNYVLGDLQGAFRNNRRTEDHICTLKGIDMFPPESPKN